MNEDWGIRSSGEREAARREREQRRLERADVDPAHPGRAPVERADVDPAHLDPDTARWEREPGDEDEWVFDFDDERGWGDDDLDAPASTGNGRAVGRDDDEPPAGTRRVSRAQRLRHRPPPASAPTARRRPAPRPERAGVRPERTDVRRRAVRVLAIVAIALGAAAIWFLYELFEPFHGSPHGEITVTIPPHAGAHEIGDRLAHEGVVSSGFFFNLRAALEGDRGKLRSGTYHLQLGMSYGAALKVLTTPPKPAKVSELTVIEGLTRHGISALLAKQKVGSTYLAETRRSPLLDPRTYGAPASTPSLEGFLFPSTYQLRDPIKISDLVRRQLLTFRQRFGTVDTTYARSKHLSSYDVLIIASMVQAEALAGRDRPLVASVIYNRLRLGMPLQIDATTRYASGNYSQPLTQSELNSPSPYNTRIHAGLPPTPINNPGLAAIKAAAQPARTGYLYFIVKPCGNGEHAFTSSYSQFEQLAQRYNAARTALGGHSPEFCRAGA